MTTYRDVDKDWDEFWEPLFSRHEELAEDGRPTLEALKNELSDYRMLLEYVPQVYSELTGSTLSKPNYEPHVVISEAQEYLDRLVRDTVADELQYMDFDEIQKWIAENKWK